MRKVRAYLKGDAPLRQAPDLTRKYYTSVQYCKNSILVVILDYKCIIIALASVINYNCK